MRLSFRARDRRPRDSPPAAPKLSRKFCRSSPRSLRAHPDRAAHAPGLYRTFRPAPEHSVLRSTCAKQLTANHSTRVWSTSLPPAMHMTRGTSRPIREPFSASTRIPRIAAHPSVDVLMNSVAETFRNLALGSHHDWNGFRWRRRHEGHFPRAASPSARTKPLAPSMACPAPAPSWAPSPAWSRSLRFRRRSCRLHAIRRRA